MSLQINWRGRAQEDRKQETIAYFDPKAAAYDKTDEQGYWAFSDKLLWHLLRTRALDKLAARKPDFTFLDAGCGTARWSMKLLQAYARCTGTLLDLTPNMLDVSRGKIAAAGYADRAALRLFDLNDLAAASDVPAYDLAICFHNVLSFVVDPAAVIRALIDRAASGATICLVIPNLYHAASFSAAQGRMEEVRRVLSASAVKFTAEVPEMWVFTPEKIRAVVAQTPARSCEVLGFPVTVYPGFEETQIEGESSACKTLFADQEAVSTLFDMECVLSSQSEAAARGNNLLVLIEKK